MARPWEVKPRGSPPCGPGPNPGARKSRGVAVSVTSTVISVSDWSIPDFGPIHSDVTIPGITQSVIDSGLVMVYLKVDDFWATLPYTRYFTDHQIVTSYKVKLNTLRVIVFETDFTNPPQDDLSLKVVIIDGN
jgi:hypothetical protein